MTDSLWEDLVRLFLSADGVPWSPQTGAPASQESELTGEPCASQASSRQGQGMGPKPPNQIQKGICIKTRAPLGQADWRGTDRTPTRDSFDTLGNSAARRLLGIIAGCSHSLSGDWHGVLGPFWLPNPSKPGSPKGLGVSRAQCVTVYCQLWLKLPERFFVTRGLPAGEWIT